ncbi:Hypothetical protein IALB_0276 [Ignavibacterium album JCM 16511]|uniref:Uncharacterized protein n=1 Tax=Ignavibacterium album (strain DSM 19864 / JCM 16511 / NBRC 101810 / Mat9-16) TaxID=945713 RepID=I0AG81_IGNAJ|nr:hypothetical protein [Ignavibacterium album]AFH47988.1 Hypothetical protein IALB_0276 [Ignavibacterium album JCM 16511]
MNPKFFTNIILIVQSLIIFFLIQALYFLFGKVNPMLLGITILVSSLTVFSLALIKAYIKDRNEKKKLSTALFEMN